MQAICKYTIALVHIDCNKDITIGLDLLSEQSGIERGKQLITGRACNVELKLATSPAEVLPPSGIDIEKLGLHPASGC